MMALVAGIEDQAECIKQHAWRRGDWGTVYGCSDDILANTRALRAAMSRRWNSLVSQAKE